MRLLLTLAALTFLGSTSNAAVYELDNHGDGKFSGDFQLAAEWSYGGVAGSGYVMSNIIDNSSVTGSIILDTADQSVTFDNYVAHAYSNVTRQRTFRFVDSWEQETAFTMFSDLATMDVSPGLSSLQFDGEFTIEGASNTFSGEAVAVADPLTFEPFGSQTNLFAMARGEYADQEYVRFRSGVASILQRERFDFDDILLVDDVINGLPFQLTLTSAVLHRAANDAPFVTDTPGTSVPEPTTALAIAMLGVGGLCIRRKRGQ